MAKVVTTMTAAASTKAWQLQEQAFTKMHQSTSSESNDSSGIDKIITQ